MACRYPVALLEDDIVLQQELSFQLEHAGFTLAAFTTAAGLNSFLEESNVVAAILDICLADGDGLSICRRLRLRDGVMGIVFITGLTQREDRLNGLSAGADAYLGKPIDVDELVLILRRLTQRYRSGGAASRLATPPTHWRLDIINGLLSAPDGKATRLSVA